MRVSGSVFRAACIACTDLTLPNQRNDPLARDTSSISSELRASSLNRCNLRFVQIPSRACICRQGSKCVGRIGSCGPFSSARSVTTEYDSLLAISPVPRLSTAGDDGWWFRMTARLMFHMTCVPHRGLPASCTHRQSTYRKT
ncbi:hypothetical protein BU25DRAFT_95816 [Macroventuria anomochaeta]|uniref:Uncharacterized protein n=1 Tax=Macroventuria anomochaeta TaxID=301207 RepID=A0ACB6RX74_9PLEO|nr:uncharacterized protein BU25DRAFT_95816 [Macroventuria anomochaeta]KAF2626323.1 hypothetical protein BU25DRAFT_95816 [Macroventuria anomochaeta]